jgi:hypothetical protein
MEENIKMTVFWNVTQLVLVGSYQLTESGSKVNMKITPCHLRCEAEHSRRKLPASGRTCCLHHHGRRDLMFLTAVNMNISYCVRGYDAVWSHIKLLTLCLNLLP